MNINFTSYLAFVLLLITIGCHDTAETSNSIDLSSDLDPGIGQQISSETAARWIALYHYTGEASRVDELSYSIKAEQFKQVLDAVKNKTGVMFHHATDDVGAHHILVTAMAQKAILWSSPVVIDANTNTLIETNNAIAWAKHYEDTNPGKIWYHFFGITMLNDITSNSDFNYFDIVPALNDVLAPQLLLEVWNTKDNTDSGRTLTDSPKVYDASKPCPPCSI